MDPLAVKIRREANAGDHVQEPSGSGEQQGKVCVRDGPSAVLPSVAPVMLSSAACSFTQALESMSTRGLSAHSSLRDASSRRLL
jgi:hypothetical protein